MLCSDVQQSKYRSQFEQNVHVHECVGVLLLLHETASASVRDQHQVAHRLRHDSAELDQSETRYWNKTLLQGCCCSGSGKMQIPPALLCPPRTTSPPVEEN